MPPVPRTSKWLPRPARNDGITPDRTELRIRFVFGAVLGIAVGAQLGSWLMPVPVWVFVLVVAATGFYGGVLATWKGDGFWRALHRYMP